MAEVLTVAYSPFGSRPREMLGLQKRKRRAEAGVGKMATCPSCGQEVGSDFAFCPLCGADLRVHPSRPPVPSDRRQRRIAVAIAAGTALALIVVALLVPTQVASGSLLSQSGSIMAGNYSVTGVQSGNPSSTYYDLSIWVTNTGNASISGISISVFPPPSSTPASGPNCSFSQTVGAAEQMEPGATVRANCMGSPYVRGGEYSVVILAGNGNNTGVASWTGQILAS
jgi:hypothetical protein